MKFINRLFNSSNPMNIGERKRLLFVCSMWGIGLFTYIRVVMERLPILSLFADFFIPIAIVGIVFYCWNALSKTIKPVDFALVLTMALVYVLHILIYPKNATLLEDNAATFFIESLPYMFVGLVIKADRDLEYLELISIITIILGIFYLSYKADDGMLGTGEDTENMGRAYAYLPHALLLLHTSIKNFNLYRPVFLLISIFIILGTGNRGTLVVIALCAVLELIFIKQYKKTILTRLIIVGMVVALMGFWERMLRFLVDVMERVGFSKRALMFLVEGDFIADSNGRDNIAHTLMTALQNSPLFGYGLCGDRLFTGMYAHNLFLEILISFGPFLGGMLCLLLIFAVIKSFLACKTEADKGLWTVMIGCGFISLFISDTFIASKSFFMMLGFCIAVIRTSSYKLKIKTK